MSGVESAHGAVRWISKNRRFVTRTLFYFALVGGGTLAAVDLLSRAIRHPPSGLRQLFFALPVPTATIDYTVIGFLLGLIGVLLIDEYKRFQGVILVLGIVLSIPVLLRYNVLIGTLVEGFDSFRGGLFAAGFGLGLVFGGVTPSRLKDDTLEFPEAPGRLLYIAIAILAVGWFEAVVVYEPAYFSPSGIDLPRFIGFVTTRPIWIDTGGILVGLYGLRQYTSYENQSRIIQIGPRRAGKSAAFGGMQVAIADKIDEMAALKSNQSVTKLSSQIKQGEFPEFTEREEAEFLSINYKTDDVFPAKMSVNSVDYAGELLGEILPINLGLTPGEAAVQSDGGQQDSQSRQRDISTTANEADDDTTSEDDEDFDTEYLGSEPVEETESWEAALSEVERVTIPPVQRSQIPQAVWECVKHSDKIILTVPLEDFIGPVVARDNHPEYFDVKPRTEDDGPERISGIIRIGPDEEARTEATIKNKYNVDERMTFERDEYDGTTYYRISPPAREDPGEYLTWYKELVKEYRGDKEFLVLVTMADWMATDYRRERNQEPAVRYDDFCDYVADTISVQYPILEDILLGSRNRRIYTTWYRIKDESPPSQDNPDLDIDVSKARGETQTLLQGADKVLEELKR